MQLDTTSISVAVWMVTYNHAAYIRQAVDSVMAQRTNFRFKLFIGEDYSTDETRNLCIALRDMYSDQIELLLNDHNIGAKENALRIYKRCFDSGAKYIALLEGDDYWTDPDKLQKQYDILEKHPEYALCHHAFDVIQDGGLIVTKDRNRLNSLKPIIEFEDILEFSYPKTLSVMFRSAALSKFPLIEFLNLDNDVGDIIIWPLILLNGKGYFLNENMGCYRSNSGGITNSMVSDQVVTRSKISILEKILSRGMYPNRSLLREYLAKHYFALFFYRRSLTHFFYSLFNLLRSKYLFHRIDINNRVTIGRLLVGLFARHG